MPRPARAQPRFFDLWSRVYDAPLVQRLTYRPVQDAVLRELADAPPASILDVGCGTGLLTTRLRDAFSPARVVGCDFSRGMLGRAAARCPELPWVRADALQLPFASSRFAAVVSTEAFHWFPDPDAALAELFRVLEPGGRLLLALVNPRTRWLSGASELGARLLGQPAHWPTRAALREQLRAAGFVAVDQRTVLRLPSPLLLPCVLTGATRPREGPAL